MGNKMIDDMMENIVMSDELKGKIRENALGECKVVKFRRPKMKKIVLVAALCVLILGAMTVIAANNAKKKENHFMDILGHDADTQKELEEDGIYQKIESSYREGDIIAVTNDGITVALKETIIDKNVVKALIQIRADESIELDEKTYFEEWFIKGTVLKTPGVGESPYEYSSTMEYAMEGTKDLEGQWCIVNLDNSNGQSWKSGDIVEIEFNNMFKFDKYFNKTIVSDGTWTLKWEINVNEKCIQIPVNETIDANGMNYHIDNVEITPCSIKINFSESAEGSVSYQPLKFKVYAKDGLLFETDKLHERLVSSCIGHDGEIYFFGDVWILDDIEKISIEGKEYTVSK